MGKLRINVFLIVIILISGCSNLHPRTEVITYGAGFPSEALMDDAGLSWHAIRFRMPFGPDGQVNWAMDLLLAHGVLGLMIAEHRDRLPLWRFHRRAGRDAAGHQFSLIFYANVSTANSLFAWLEGDAILASAREKGLLNEVIQQIEPFEDASLLSATSDKIWHPALQKQWPSYIMGVSATWLGLIEELVPAPETEHETL